MKVILLEDIKGVGKKDEIIEAKEGYARNFLIPKKKAIEANATNMSVYNSKMDKRQHDKKVAYDNAMKIKERIEKLNIIMEAKCGDNDKLFGTITAKDISQRLEKENVTIDKKKIVIKDNIKTTGVYMVQLRLDEGVVANVRILVKGV